MQVPTVPPLEGVEDLYSLLAFLTDPDAVEKRLNAMEKVRDEINVMIEKVGKAADIDRLSIQAAVDREAAGKELGAARSQAKAFMDGARRQVAESEAAFERQHKLDEADLAKRRDELNTQSRAHAMDVARMQEDYDKARALHKEAQSIMAEARTLRQEYEGKLAKLKAAGVA